ncbi:MAG TPA: MerR family transcriptional regulator [Acidimicrobiales bacterium]|nr:MerR family transcriptional regulator [Acidimicrobiales bacterium]
MGILDEHQALVNAQRVRPLPTSEGHSTHEAAKRSGLTYRQLTYWIKAGIITPSVRTAAGTGERHRWSDGDVRMLRRVRQLLDAGVSLQRVRSALPFIRDPEGCRWLFVSAAEPPTVGVCAAGELEQAVRGDASIVIDLGGDGVGSLTCS